MLAAEPAEYFGERACGLALHREPDPCSLGDTRFANGLVFDTVVDPPNDAVAAELEVVNDFGGKKNPLTTVVIGGSCPLPFGEFGDGSKYIWQRKTPLHMGEDPNSVVGDLEGEGIVVLPYTHAGRTSARSNATKLEGFGSSGLPKTLKIRPHRLSRPRRSR